MKLIVAVCKLIGEHKGACFVCIECVKCGFLGIVDSLRNVLLIVNAPHLEADAGYRDNLAGLSILLHDSDVCCDNSIVDDIWVCLAVFVYDNVEVLNEFCLLPACGLVNSVCSVREFLCLSKSIFVCNEIVTLVFLSLIITACGLEIYFKLSTTLRRFDACCTVIAVLDDRYLALYYVLCNVKSDRIDLYFIVLRLGTYLVYLVIELITL